MCSLSTARRPAVSSVHRRCRRARLERMIEPVDGIPALARSGVAPAVAARRARQRNRVLRAVEASSGWPEFAPQVGAAEGPLGEAQRAEREIARWTAVR